LKFLIKIEEAIDSLILSFVEKMKKATPHFVFQTFDWIKHTPQHSKALVKKYQPKLKIMMLKTVGYTEHYTTMLRGLFIGVLIYLKSEEFKKANKVEMVVAPLRKFKTDPVKAFSVLLASGFLLSAGFFIFKNTEKIIVGTKALRAPASHIEEEPILELKKIKYTVLEKEIFLDVTVTAASIEERDKLLPIEKEIEEHLSGIHITAAALPLTTEDMKRVEAEILSKIAGAKISSVSVKQVLEGRPKYFLQLEKMTSIKDLNLQLFLEDTKRNRQVWIDFTSLASNRNVVLFLKDHSVEVRDYLNMHVEPVIPQLPIEEEGRQIIKEKLRLELNQFLKDNQIEGQILEIYVDYLMVS